MTRTIAGRRQTRASGNAEIGAGRPPREMLVGQVLDALRFHGWFFCISDLTAPWGLQLPGGRLAAVHAVLEGECVLKRVGEAEPIHLCSGDIVVLPRDEVHAIADRSGSKVRKVSDIPGLVGQDRIATTFTYGGGGVRARILTASFAADTPSAGLIVAGLPSALTLRAGTAAWARVEPVLALIRAEAADPGGVSSAVLRRVAEVLFIQSLREALLGAQPVTGWMAAASDPRLAAALAAMHAQPGRQWTLAGLAPLANLSRTAFLERFQASLGQTPTEYLQWWRMQLAAQRLRETDDSVGAIALAVGYDSPSAFARAFRRAHAQSPNTYRAGRDGVGRSTGTSSAGPTR